MPACYQLRAPATLISFFTGLVVVLFVYPMTASQISPPEGSIVTTADGIGSPSSLIQWYHYWAGLLGMYHLLHVIPKISKTTCQYLPKLAEVCVSISKPMDPS
jgi:hypothetical protein